MLKEEDLLVCFQLQTKMTQCETGDRNTLIPVGHCFAMKVVKGKT